MAFSLLELERAVRLQQQAYALLKWFQNHLDRALFPAYEAHAALDGQAVAQQWIESNLSYLPSDLQPAAVDIAPLASLFSSYLTTSFDLVENPSYRAQTTSGCWCEICTTLARCAHLQPKRISSGDKAHAERFKRQMLDELAKELGLVQNEAQNRALLADQTLRESIALVTYAQNLVRRLEGDSGDPAILVLWREFAWTRSGAPKKGFLLKAEDILAAHEQVIRVLNKTRPEGESPRS